LSEWFPVTASSLKVASILEFKETWIIS